MLNRLKAALLSGDTIRGNALRIYAMQFITIFFSLAGSVVVAKTLGPTQKGEFDLFNLLRNFLVDFGLLGFGSGLMYYFVRKDYTLAQVHGTAFVFALAAGAVAALLGILCLPLWKSLFAGLPVWAILLVFFFAPVNFYVQIWGSVLTGMNQAVRIQRNGLAFTFLTVLAILMLSAKGFLNVHALMIISTSILALNGLVCFGWIYLREPRMEPSMALAKDSLRYGSTIFIGVLANQLHFRIDQLMVSHWLGIRQVGLYALSVRWAEMLFLLDTAIMTAGLHKIGSSSREESYALTKRLFRVQLMISGGAGLLLALIAYPLLTLTYGPLYQESILPLILLIPGTVAWSVAKLLSVMLTYNRNLATYTTGAAILGIVVNILLNVVFLSHQWGIRSVALASSISYFLVALVMAVKVHQFREVADGNGSTGSSIG